MFSWVIHLFCKGLDSKWFFFQLHGSSNLNSLYKKLSLAISYWIICYWFVSFSQLEKLRFAHHATEGNSCWRHTHLLVQVPSQWLSHHSHELRLQVTQQFDSWSSHKVEVLSSKERTWMKLHTVNLGMLFSSS